MPNLDPATRARLADALEGATPEMLREDAEFGHGLAAHPSLNDGGRDALRRLAALALAVAEMQERGVRAASRHPDWFVTDGGGLDWWHESSPEVARSLPSALAALLRTSEGA